ncbi:MAG TPA: hypothetical protein VHO90_10805 [Bacteroidales bacterium]|nr:hypothetical protein [Bacteroidales bacterium]
MSRLVRIFSVFRIILFGVLFSVVLGRVSAQNAYSDQVVTIDDNAFLPFRKGKVVKHLEGDRAALLEKIYQAIASWDTLNSPKGFEANFYGIGKNMDVTFSAYVKEENTITVNGGAVLSFFVNDPARIMGSPVVNNIFLQPEKVAAFYGYPVYQNTNTEVTVITKSKAPLFVPVTQEEYLTELIKSETKKAGGEAAQSPKSDSETVLAEMGKTYRELLKTDAVAAAEFKTEMQNFKADMANLPKEDALTSMLSLLKKELEDMPAADRSKPAWYSTGAMEKYSNFSGLVPESNSDEGTALVKLSPALASMTNVNDAIKVLVIRWNLGNDNSASDKPRLFNGDAKGYMLADYHLAKLYNNKKIWTSIINLMQ